MAFLCDKPESYNDVDLLLLILRGVPEAGRAPERGFCLVFFDGLSTKRIDLNNHKDQGSLQPSCIKAHRGGRCTLIG